MNTPNRTENLRARLAILRQEQERVEKLLKEAERPSEPSGAWPCVSFTVHFKGRESEPWSFAARKSGGFWYTTSGSGAGYTWPELLDWIEEFNVGGLEGSNLALYSDHMMLVPWS